LEKAVTTSDLATAAIQGGVNYMVAVAYIESRTWHGTTPASISAHRVGRWNSSHALYMWTK
jgi:hypothetical protein